MNSIHNSNPFKNLFTNLNSSKSTSPFRGLSANRKISADRFSIWQDPQGKPKPQDPDPFMPPPTPKQDPQGKDKKTSKPAATPDPFMPPAPLKQDPEKKSTQDPDPFMPPEPLQQDSKKPSKPDASDPLMPPAPKLGGEKPSETTATTPDVSPASETTEVTADAQEDSKASEWSGLRARWIGGFRKPEQELSKPKGVEEEGDFQFFDEDDFAEKQMTHIPAMNQGHLVSFKSDETPIRGFLDVGFRGDGVSLHNPSGSFFDSNSTGVGGRLFVNGVFQSGVRIDMLDSVPLIGGLLGGITSGEVGAREAGIEYFRSGNGDFEAEAVGTVYYSNDVQFHVPYFSDAVNEMKYDDQTNEWIDRNVFSPTLNYTFYGQRNHRFPDFNPLFVDAEQGYGHILYLRDSTPKGLWNFVFQYGKVDNPNGQAFDRGERFQAGYFLPAQFSENDSSATNLFSNDKLLALYYEKMDLEGFRGNGDRKGEMQSVRAMTEFTVPDGMMGVLGNTQLKLGVDYAWGESSAGGNQIDGDSFGGLVALERSFATSDTTSLNLRVGARYGLGTKVNSQGDLGFGGAWSGGVQVGFTIAGKKASDFELDR